MNLFKNNKGNTTTVGIVVVVLVIVLALFFVVFNQSKKNADEQKNLNDNTMMEQEDSAMMDDDDMMENGAGETMMVGDERLNDDNDAMVGGDAMVGDDNAMMDKDDTMMESEVEVETEVMAEDSTMASVKTFEVNGFEFGFSLDEIRVKKGDRVKIVFTSTGGFHDWVLDEFSAATKQVSKGNTSVVEFVADKQGTFEFYCSVGRHKDFGMVGNLIVE